MFCCPRSGRASEITWLGHSSVLLDMDGVRLLADPLLRDRVGFRRRTVPASESAAVDSVGVSAVLLSHLHDDHCDLRSLRRLDAPVVVASPGAGPWLTAQEVRGVSELRPGRSLAIGPVVVHAIPAKHDGSCRRWGPRASAVGHVVTGSASAYLAGDTALHEGMASVSEIAGLPGPDLAVLPVWGGAPDSGPGIGPRRRRPRRRCWCVPGTRCRCTGAPCTRVGMHWVMRRRLVDPGPAFAAAVTALGQRRHWEPETLPRVSVLPVGGLLEVAGRPLIGARTASGDASKPGSVDVGTGAAVTTRRLACCLASRSTPQCATERHRGR
jgi:L-ascorbate metabolism protein UlaG (beta-lactamase superfamily)